MWVNYFQKISLLYGTIKSRFWDFPSGPMVVKSLHFHCRVAGESLTPGWKTKILHAPRQKTNKKKPKQTRLYRCHLFNVSSSPLNDRGHGSAHPSILRTADSSSGRPPRRVSLRPGGWHWGDTLGVPLLSAACLPHCPTGTTEIRPKGGSQRWPRTKVDSVIFQKRSLQPHPSGL